jgi:outer membrane protein
VKLYGLVISLFSVCCCAECVAPAKKTSFEEAVIAAYNNYPGWFSQQTKKRIADEQLLQARTAFLPDIRCGLTALRAKKETYEFGSVAHFRGTETDMALTLSQNLFDGFATVNRIKSHDNAAEAAYHELKMHEQELIINVLEAYAGIWLGRQKVVALKRREENLKKVLNSHESALEAGMNTSSDVSEANANYQNAISDRIKAETDLFSFESEFEKLTGLKMDENPELPNLNVTLPETLEELVKTAMSSNHAVKYHQFMKKAAEANLNMQKGALSPSCDLKLQASKNLYKPPQGRTCKYNASLEVSVPLFANPSSGNIYSSIAIADQKALEAKFNAENSKLEIRKQCVVHWNTYISAGAMIKYLRSAVKSAELSSESKLEESAFGTKSNTDVLIAENKLLESRINLAESRKNKLVAALKLYGLTGHLSLSSIFEKKNNK